MKIFKEYLLQRLRISNWILVLIILSGCHTEDDLLKENAIIFKRKFTTCACCPDSFLIALKTNTATIPELLVEDSAKAFLNRPSDFKLDYSYTTPVKVVLGRKLSFVKICQDSGVHVEKIARNYETSLSVGNIPEKGSTVMIVDSLFRSKSKKYLYRNNPKDASSNTFKAEKLSALFSVGFNNLSYALSFDLKKHQYFKYDLKDTLNNILTVKQNNAPNFAISNYREANGSVYITKIDTVKKVISGRYNADVFSPIDKRKLNISGYFYQIPVVF